MKLTFLERGEHMKKRLMVCLLTCVMALSVAVPAMAEVEATTIEQIYTVAEQEIVPATEMTRIYWRNHYGVLQFRVWSITNGRWITEWTTVA